MSDPVENKKGGVRLQIGTPAVVKIPARAFRARLTGMLFDTDKTFLLPKAMAGIRQLKTFYDEHPGLEVLVVGHADSRGDAEYNRKLSEERARSIGSFLRDLVDAWLEYYRAAQPVGKAWGAVEDAAMLGALGLDGVRAFQEGNGLSPDGVAGPDTRRLLVTKYMQQDGTTLPAGTKLEIHGCGELHPEDPGDSEDALRKNRRVEVFLFEGAIEPAPQAKCPGPGGCPERAVWIAKSVETIDLTDTPEETVTLEVEWAEDVVDQLSGDVTIRLSGSEIAAQMQSLSSGTRANSVVVLAFGKIAKTKAVTMTALSGGTSLVLFQDQVVSDLATAITWARRLEELLPPPPADGGEPVLLDRPPDDATNGELV